MDKSRKYQLPLLKLRGFIMLRKLSMTQWSSSLARHTILRNIDYSIVYPMPVIFRPD